MNTEYLPGQLDLEDAIRALDAAGASGDMDEVRDAFMNAQGVAWDDLEKPQQLRVTPESFESFMRAAWVDPKIRRHLWPHLPACAARRVTVPSAGLTSTSGGWRSSGFSGAW